MEIITGPCIGLILDLTGAGGSVVAVPLLVGLLMIPIQQAIGISLGVVGVSAFFFVVSMLAGMFVANNFETNT